MDLKSTLYQKLSEQDKQNIKELTNKYKTSDYTLAEIFNVKSEIYKKHSALTTLFCLQESCLLLYDLKILLI